MKRPKPTPAEKAKLTKKLNNIRRWYERMLKEFALAPHNKPAPK